MGRAAYKQIVQMCGQSVALLLGYYVQLFVFFELQPKRKAKWPPNNALSTSHNGLS